METNRAKLSQMQARAIAGQIFLSLPPGARKIGAVWPEYLYGQGYQVAVKWRGETYRVRSLAEWRAIQGDRNL